MIHCAIAAAVLAAGLAQAQSTGQHAVLLQARLGVAAGETPATVETSLAWNSTESAILVCDMWDRRWCAGATERVNDLAPRLRPQVDHFTGTERVVACIERYVCPGIQSTALLGGDAFRLAADTGASIRE